jgi:hypothetical protein
VDQREEENRVLGLFLIVVLVVEVAEAVDLVTQCMKILLKWSFLNLEITVMKEEKKLRVAL